MKRNQRETAQAVRAGWPMTMRLERMSRWSVLFRSGAPATMTVGVARDIWEEAGRPQELTVTCTWGARDE